MGVGTSLPGTTSHRRLPAAAFFGLFVVVGAFSVLPGMALYLLVGLVGPAFPGRWGEVLFVWTVNAPIEELSKYLSFAVAAGVLRSVRQPQDGSLQGVATGLGFGLVENLLYGLSGGGELFLFRTLVSLPGHLVYGAVWGGYHGYEVYRGRGRLGRPWVPLLALVPAAFSHAAYNTLALVGAPFLTSLATDGLTFFFGLFLFLRLRALSPVRLNRPLRDWRMAVPELEHALCLDPGSPRLRRRLAAYLLAGAQASRALELLAPLPPDPWTTFYRDAALRRSGRGSTPPPPSAALNPALFRTLSGG